MKGHIYTDDQGEHFVHFVSRISRVFKVCQQGDKTEVELVGEGMFRKRRGESISFDSIDQMEEGFQQRGFRVPEILFCLNLLTKLQECK